ncbi:MAG: GAF domain-containing sensor histidine kinase [Anaerolineales bacterium]
MTEKSTQPQSNKNTRVEETARKQMVALHRATLSLFSDLSLNGVLRRVINAARELSGARYAAIGIPGKDKRLETFITVGMTEEEVNAIDHMPVGEGLLGEMIRTGQSIRLMNLTQDPRAAGFPEGHPKMTSFLGVPIAAYGQPLGQIYLTNKQTGKEFDAEDQRLIEMLASHAAAAIENARLYRKVLDNETELTQRNAELELINNLATAVGSATDLDDLLEEMLGRVMNLFQAPAGEIFLREETEGSFRKAIHRGEASKAFWTTKRFRHGEGFIGRAAELGRPIWTTKLSEETDLSRDEVVAAGFKTLACVPLRSPGGVVGVLVIAFKFEREFEDREVGLLDAVGAGVGIAVENGRLYRQARRLAVLEERERIGMDLHDGIIQSIYAIGLTLEYAKLLVKEDPPETASRIEQAIDGLNAAIRDLRSYILDLQPSRIPTDDLESALARLVKEFKANTLVDADLHLEEDVLEQISKQAGMRFFLIAQEALANIAKHAQATRVLVTLRRINDQISLQIIDNGRGFDINQQPDVLGHGLSNMAERAQQAGGEFEVVSSEGDGTTVTVRVPLERLSPDSIPTSDYSSD